MKNKIVFAIRLGMIISSSLVLFYSCQKSTEAELNPKLFITNGFFTLNDSGTMNEFKCAVKFEYQVVNEECDVGGFCIKFNQNEMGCVDWYIKRRLKPGVIYSIADTFKLSEELITFPSAIMEGYKVGSSESSPELRAEYLLHPK
jgi:hypothetical protein